MSTKSMKIIGEQDERTKNSKHSLLLFKTNHLLLDFIIINPSTAVLTKHCFVFHHRRTMIMLMTTMTTHCYEQVKCNLRATMGDCSFRNFPVLIFY